MSSRSWMITLAIVGGVFALAALVVSIQEVALLYGAAHPRTLTQFDPPGIRMMANPGLRAADTAWMRLPLVVLLWLLTVSCFTALLVIWALGRTPRPSASSQQ